ncbi:hypothetical protein C2E25_12895 [Geothermobacter hydrogeniphilus]|uniref:Formylmethanofuran dehydrogenase subunit E domain-containing protein n=2 Tax=Geothermobacter hydrogeniphilus TaxID=1969733 RepID=A0A2K2H823_9BACT|nr:hypothetical protein C2E25_12895 [Geothermobacter hydrogeniphilus]
MAANAFYRMVNRQHMITPAPDIFARIYARHGHRCTMSTLGGRIGLAVLRLRRAEWGDVRGSYLTRTCAVDGIAEVTGLSEDDDRLQVIPEGRHLLRLEHAVGRLEIELAPTALELAGNYRRLGYQLEAGWDDLDSAERERREGLREEALDALLVRLWDMGDDELLLIREENHG